jgi:manganese transport protein
MLAPIAGRAGSAAFAAALLFAGLSSSITAGMAGGTIFAGMFGESYDIQDKHSRAGAAITIAGALACVFFISDPFSGLVWSQVALSIQLPFTIILQVSLTSSKRVMGARANSPLENVLLWSAGAVVATLNVALLLSMAAA